jgi:hypothetical protein
MREDDGQTGTLTVSRAGPLNDEIIVYLAYAGSAIVFDDYRTIDEAIPDWVVMPAGVGAIDLEFYAPDDEEPEPTETVEISLLPDPAYNVGFPSQATLKILDNDLGILRVGRNADASVTLTWSTEQGRVYQIVYKDSLSQSNWLPLSPALSDGSGTLTWTDTTAGASGQRFYSVQKLP